MTSSWSYLDIDRALFQWSADFDPESQAPERVFVFEREVGETLSLASNFPYELWLDERMVYTCG